MSTLDGIIPPISRMGLEQNAKALILKFQPGVFTNGEAFDVESFVEFHLEDLTEIEYHVTDDLPIEIEGYTDPMQKKLWVHAAIAEETTTNGLRRFRSTLAHEVGHCLHHVEPIRNSGTSLIFSQRKGGEECGTELYRKVGTKKAYLNPEWQAYNFAGALLMPFELVAEMLGRGATVFEMAERFDVNPAFVETRVRVVTKMIQN